ncbi:MAG: hypothetical protein RLZZ416_344 [Candidatus Parcubacteria bacterium]
MIALLAVAGWKIEQTIAEKRFATTYVASASSASSDPQKENPPGLTDQTAQDEALWSPEATPLGNAVLGNLITRYVTLESQGSYTPDRGEKTAEAMASTLKPSVAYVPFTSADIKTTPDTSYERMLAYRKDLQGSLAPLMKNTRPEFELFGQYVETKDSLYLARLRAVAKDYADAATASAHIVVPADASPYHVAILNAMRQFGATLNEMAANASDPFASVALLRSYNQAETDMLVAFRALVSYEKSKLPL